MVSLLRSAGVLTSAFILTAAASAQPVDVPTYGPLRQPVPVPGVKPVPIATIDALKGDGIFYIYGSRVANLRAADTPQSTRHPLTEISNDKAGAVNGHMDTANFVLNGERRPVGRPNFAVPADDGSAQLIYSGENPLRLNVNLKAFDVSGLHIQPFLRTPDNYPKQEAPRAGSATFPAGSVAYLVEARFVDDVLMLPGRESFTGASSTAQLVANFSKKIPYCLAYEDRQGAKPYAMMFKPAPGKKGQVALYPAKTGTLFCDRNGGDVLGEGEWEERTIAGTRAVVLSFPANVDPLDTGVSNFERDSARIAFIEPTRGTPGVRPGKLYQAGASIYDFQYRFNRTAADAVRQAIGTP
jgi:hypothetical protein